ncbi:MAG: LysM peptidoglycan-binding domain-containing protein [Gammaproteobacteria bacterium]|nr:LysM peptidoglycan-binding domain-containing protein [Gammaproteobacteria bacterium]
MFYAHSPLIRSACLVVTAALGVVVAGGSLAQIRDGGPTSAAVGQADRQPVLNPRHPERYVVQRGDTLWDIAAMFLRDPWYWPEIWQINPQVENPHLIYPGDILSLTYVDGRPVLQVERGASGDVERLSPRVRSEPLEEAIPTIPFESIRAFLSRPAVLDPDQLETLPYVLAHEDGMIGSAGRDVYVRGTDAAVGEVYNVVHAGDELVDPDDGTLIGYEGIYVGQGQLRRAGDPATLRLTQTTREAIVGDYLLEEEGIVPIDFVPRAPEQDVDGRIIAVLDGLDLIGQYQIIVINRGAQHGLEPGHVLRIFRPGDTVRDTVGGGGAFGEKVRLPDESAGIMMTFRTFDRISYALVMEATKEIRVLDPVRNP